MADDLSGAKVGDQLFVTGRFDRGHLTTVDRITPTGRVVTKSGEFNPDGSKRGDTGWHRQHARLATADDIAGINRYNLTRKLEMFRAWDKLSPDDLKAVSDIVKKHSDQNR
jgi:hypothetical protein